MKWKTHKWVPHARGGPHTPYRNLNWTPTVRMRWEIRHAQNPRLYAKPKYFPFTEPRYMGSYPFPNPLPTSSPGSWRQTAVYKSPGRARYLSSSVAALSGITARRFLSSAEAAPMRNKGSTVRAKRNPFYDPPPPGFVPIPGYPPVGPDRTTPRFPDPKPGISWRNKIAPGVLRRYIDVHGIDAFRAKVCEERRMRREVLHAKAIAGTRVARPTFDVRSMVIC